MMPNLKDAKYKWVDSDVLEALNLTKVKVLDDSPGAEVLLLARKNQPSVKRVIKKFLLDDEDEDDDRQVMKKWAYFEREVSFLQALKHPNIVSITGAYHCSSYLGFVMEFLPTDLYNRLPYLSYMEGASCFHQLVDVLCFLHERRVIHGDIKLENVLLGSSGTIKLCDFGHAQIVPPRPWQGTHEYLAPEKFNTSITMDAFKMDAYSLGIVAWALFFDTHPDDSISYATRIFRSTFLEPNHKKCLERLLDHSPSYRATMWEARSILREDIEDTGTPPASPSSQSPDRASSDPDAYTDDHRSDAGDEADTSVFSIPVFIGGGQRDVQNE